MIQNLARIENLKRSKMWRPLHATDLESLMYPNFYVSTILGCFPYKSESNNYVFSKKLFVWSTLIILIFLIFTSITIYQINVGILICNDVTMKMYANLGFILGGGVILQMHLYSNQRLRALRSVTEIAQLLSPKDFNDLAKYFHTKDIIGVLFIAIHLPNCFTGNVYMIMRHLVIFYILTATLAIDMLYMNCVCIVKVGFRKIHESLEQFNKFSTNDESNSDAPFIQKAPRDKRRSTLLLMKLRNIEEEHLRISDVVNMLNKTFFAYNAALTAMTFLVVTFNLYFYILWKHGAFTEDAVQQFWYIQFLPNVLHYTVKFSMIIWACQTAKKEALEISTTIHDVLGNATDTLVKHELELFSLQVLHRDNTFSARVVTMNTALLTQMVGGVVMYFLILIQFLLSTIGCNRRN